MKRIFASIVIISSITSVHLLGAKDYSGYYLNLPCPVEQVRPVVIPEYSVSITEFGAEEGGEKLCTEAFKTAIKHLTDKGGGHLIVPDGVWLSGPIRLRSNIDLHLASGATLRFSPNKELYVQKNDTLRDGSKKCYALIYGSHCENVSITGSGTIDGQGIYWRPVKSEKVSKEQWDEIQTMGGVVVANGKNKIWYPFNLKPPTP